MEGNARWCHRHFDEGGESIYPVEVRVEDDDLSPAADPGEFSIFKMSRLDVALNDDDDNKSNVKDLAEHPVSKEDDLREVDLKPLLPPVKTDAKEYFFSYDSARIRVWDTADKQKLILPRTSMPLTIGGSSFSGLPTIPYTGQEKVFVEGITSGRAAITLSWLPTALALVNPYPICQPPSPNSFGGSVDVTVWSIDVDIDSDNNGILEHSAWEEELEDHEFALGKLLYWRKPLDPKGDPVEIQVSLPLGLDPLLVVTIAGTTKEVGSSGLIELMDAWKRPIGRTQFEGIVGTFTLASLGYSPATGKFSIFIRQPLMVASPKTMIEADAR